MNTLLLELYPALADVTPRWETLGEETLSVSTQTILFDENKACQGFPLVLDGEIKVSRHSSDGRALELYRVVPGELCLVSSASLFGKSPLSAQGMTTRPTRLMMISPALFHQWIATPSFRDEILGLFADRMADLTSLIDAVTFQRLDQRLASALLGHGQQRPVTHQQLADELGTVREIVSRLLRRFEREGWVELGRERIIIQDSKALRSLANRRDN